MAKWRKRGIFLEPLFKFKCLGCKDPLATFWEMGYALCNFPLDVKKPKEYNGYALDRQFHCKLCGWKMVFGIALEKKHWEAVVRNEDRKRTNQLTLGQVDTNQQRRRNKTYF